MKVTKAQAQANRHRVVETAAQLFQEHGYDGIGVAELMAAAGLTHGGFYKHFASKADLMAEAAACGMAQRLAAGDGVDPAEFIGHYLSREHRDARGSGCTIAALSGDAARKSEAVKATFASGIENCLAALSQGLPDSKRDPRDQRDRQIATLAQIVGALLLSRACPNDSPLADEILDACRRRLRA